MKKTTRSARQTQSKSWPVLRSYDADHLARIAMPIGGIGTGCISLGGRGDLRDWELVNRPAKGYAPKPTFFAIFAKVAGDVPVARALEGPLNADLYEGSSGSPAANHGLPRFRKARFDAAYPLGQVHLSDPDFPLEVRIEAFNPLIPGDVDGSSCPVAMMRFVLRNRTKRNVSASVCGTLTNFIGTDGTVGEPRGAVNEFRSSGETLSGLFMRSSEVKEDDRNNGTLALAVISPKSKVSSLPHWPRRSWGNSLLHFWDDFSTDGRLEAIDDKETKTATGSVAAQISIKPGAEVAVTFLLSWHFPNRMTWSPGGDRPRHVLGNGACEQDAPAIGNHYAHRFADAWKAAEQFAEQLPALEKKTVQFVSALCETDLPEVVKEAALFNLSTLKSPTVFRTPDGHFFGWEGCHDRHGSCHGSCTHVWNYELATGFLFAEMARSMREVEFLHATLENGLMCFRVNLPLKEFSRSWPKAAADGQMGCLIKLYREWQLSGDDAWLATLWPSAKKAMEFCWIPGGWDADRDGVMEGSQHNTMDVEYFGPNPQMQAFYLAALLASAKMAEHVGDSAFAQTCLDLFSRGRAWTDKNLFNGEYYEHEIRPPGDSPIAEGLQIGMGASNKTDPDLQLGAGCLVDQLVGQYLAQSVGLGHVLDSRNVRKTLASIFKYNRRREFFSHFNHMRSYALGSEEALLMASYPRGRRPKRPFPYYNEVMTGFEYTAAIGMIQEGLIEQGLKVISAIRARYDGAKRSPFDEAECGHHYARAMASWGAVVALSGFEYSAVKQSIVFAAQAGRWFWSTGSAWGSAQIRRKRGKWEVELTSLHGEVRLKSFSLQGVGMFNWPSAKTLKAGDSVSIQLPG